MTDFLRSMAWPFAACLVLTGIHVYLGIHVIARKVIFVDLALATIAALGAVWAALLGWDIHHDTWAVKGFSLGFTFLGAAVFSFTRMKHERVPHEAVIGIAYAVALGAIILGTAKLPHGAEEVRDLQAGSILWVSRETILFTAGLYAVIGLFHWVFRRRFLAISLDAERAAAAGIRVRLWDFLFYASFGFVVTSSVSIAGVLLVFSYLVIPSVVAVLFAESIAARLAIGWSVGTLVSAAGVSISWFEDLPSGPVIVVCFGAFLALAGVVHYVLHSEDTGRSLLRVLGFGGTLALLLVGSTRLRKQADLDLAHLLESGTKAERIQALAQVSSAPERWPEIAPQAAQLLESADIEVRLNLLDLVASQHRRELLPSVHRLLTDPDDTLRDAALKCVRALEDPSSVEALLAAAETEEDEYLRVELAEGLIELGDRRGVAILLEVMEGGGARQARKDAWEHLNAHLAPSIPFRPEAGDAERSSDVQALRDWWEREAPPLRH
jgi:zinc/manganese transport system permease protein